MSKGNELWNGVPIETYIGGPLLAVVKAQLMLTDSTGDFIEKVGYEESDSLKPRHVKFAYNRTAFDQKSQSHCVEQVHVDVPLLSLVHIPNLLINKFDYSFSLDIKTVETQEKQPESDQGELLVDNKDLTDVRLYGSITVPTERKRESDNSGIMNIEIQAEQSPIPEGLARVIDLMNQAITPKVIHRKQLPSPTQMEKKDLLQELIEGLNKEELMELLERLNKSKNE